MCLYVVTEFCSSSEAEAVNDNGISAHVGEGRSSVELYEQCLSWSVGSWTLNSGGLVT